MILSNKSRGSIDLDLLIDDAVRQNRLGDILLIVPTNRKLRKLKTELISQSPARALNSLNIHTLTTLSQLLTDMDNSPWQMADEATAGVLLMQSFQEVELSFFSNYKGTVPKGTLDKIKNVISEYKRHGITPAKLLRESENLTGSEKRKAVDIAHLFEKYNEKFKELEIKETGDVYAEFAGMPKEEQVRLFHEHFPGVSTVILNGFSEFSEPEVTLISSVSGFENITVFINFDYYTYNPRLFGHLDGCFRRLEEAGFIQLMDAGTAGKNAYYKELLRKHLFKANSGEPKTDITPEAYVIEATDSSNEIIAAAKEIKRLLLAGEAEPSDIALIINRISDYSPFIRDIFSQYGIPYNLTDRYPLSVFQPVIAVLNFLDIAENDFYYRHIFRAFSGEYIKPEKAELLDFMLTASDLKIISGYSSWRDAIQVATQATGENAPSRKMKTVYENVLADLEYINTLLLPFYEQMTLKQFIDEFEKLVNSLRIPEIILKVSRGSEEENSKALATLMDISNTLFSLLELEYNKEDAFPLSFFLNQLRTAVESTRFNIKERPNYGVQITTPNEIRGLSFKYLFVSGLYDNNFPTRFAPEVFFSGTYARSEYQHILEERYLFYQSLCSCEKRLYFTYPLNEKKRELVPSAFYRAYEAVFEVKAIERDLSELVYSKEEFLTLANMDEELKRTGDIDSMLPPSESISEAKSIDIDRLQDPFGQEKSTAYKGYIFEELSEEAAAELTSLTNAIFSTSQLETYAKCPFRYFAERVLHLQPIDEPTEETEPLELGSLLHSLLYDFSKTMQKKGIKLAGCDNVTFEAALDTIFSLAEEKIDEYNLHSPLSFFEVEKILGINGDRKESILYKFLSTERNNNSGFVPVYFELPFGQITRSDEKNYQPEFSVGSVRLRGVIDRIDLNNESKLYMIIDYKSGATMPNKKDFGEGLSLQLPLYMIAAGELLKNASSDEYDPAYPVIYSLKYKEDIFGMNHMTPPRQSVDYAAGKPEREKIVSDNELRMEQAAEFITEYADKISKGFFHLTTREKRNAICRYCEYTSVCRISDAGSS